MGLQLHQHMRLVESVIFSLTLKDGCLYTIYIPEGATGITVDYIGATTIKGKNIPPISSFTILIERFWRSVVWPFTMRQLYPQCMTHELYDKINLDEPQQCWEARVGEKIPWSISEQYLTNA